MSCVRQFIVIVGILTIPGLSGCTHAVTSTLLTSEAAEKPATGGGLTYYLPMRYAKVTFERTKADNKAAEAVAKAKEAVKEKKAALEAAEAATVAQNELIVRLGKEQGLEEQIKAAQADLIKLDIEKSRRKAEFDAAEAAEKKANLALSEFVNSQPMCGWVDSIKVALLEPVPDTSARYELNAKHSATRHDHFTLGTTTSGLLKTINAELKDQTGEILVSLAKSVVAPGRPPGVVPMVETPKKGTRCEELNWLPISAVWVVDPSKKAEWDKVTKSIQAIATVLPVDPEKQGRSFNYAVALSGDPTHGASPAIPGDGNGIFYRRERPFLVEVTLNETSPGKPAPKITPLGAFVLLAPNGAPADAIHIKASPFVTNDFKVGFDNGILVSLDTTRPSEVLEVVSIPWKVAKETMSIVTELIQLRVDYDTDKTALVEQQVKLLEQMQAVIEAQRKLDAAATAPAADPPAPEIPPAP